jgi:hypothetical protein
VGPPRLEIEQIAFLASLLMNWSRRVALSFGPQTGSAGAGQATFTHAVRNETSWRNHVQGEALTLA